VRGRDLLRSVPDRTNPLPPAGTGREFAAERLTALAQTRGAIGKIVPEVLFLCAYNAGRSQIAASLGDRYAAGRVHVRCAGSHPADWLDLTVLEAHGANVA
jgi:hypothetical protein